MFYCKNYTGPTSRMVWPQRSPNTYFVITKNQQNEKKSLKKIHRKIKKNCFFYRAVLHIVCSVQIFPTCFWLAGPACNWFLVLRFDAISLRLRRNFRMAAFLLIAVHWFGFKCNRDDIIALAPSLKIFVQNTDANTLYQWPTLYSKENNFQCRAYVFLGKFCGFALSTFSGSKKTAQEIERKCIELYRWLEQIRTHTHTHTHCWMCARLNWGTEIHLHTQITWCTGHHSSKFGGKKHTMPNQTEEKTALVHFQISDAFRANTRSTEPNRISYNHFLGQQKRVMFLLCWRFFFLLFLFIHFNFRYSANAMPQ